MSTFVYMKTVRCLNMFFFLDIIKQIILNFLYMINLIAFCCANIGLNKLIIYCRKVSNFLLVLFYIRKILLWNPEFLSLQLLIKKKSLSNYILIYTFKYKNVNIMFNIFKSLFYFHTFLFTI